MATPEDAIAFFRSLLGTHEQPPGSNHVPGITDFLHTPNGSTTGDSPWCAEAVSKVLAGVGETDLYGLQFVNGCAYVPYITRAYQNRGRFVGSGSPGDLVVFVWGGQYSDAMGDHIGMVISQNADGSYHTIEGNSPNPNRDGLGDEVAEHDRPRNLIKGFCRVAWDEAPVPTPQPPPPPPPPPPPAPPPPPPPPAVNAPPFGHNLFLSSPHMMHDAYVQEWQQKMHDRGWGITVDGWYGRQSDGTCRLFQREKNLVVDGIVGPATWGATWVAPVT